MGYLIVRTVRQVDESQFMDEKKKTEAPRDKAAHSGGARAHIWAFLCFLARMVSAPLFCREGRGGPERLNDAPG